MLRYLVALLQIAIAPVLVAASPRITFERVVPAPLDLGQAEEIAVVQAIGDSPKIESFLEDFVRQINRSGLVRARDARGATGPADIYLDVKNFTCSTTVREGEGSARDVDSKRVRRRHVFAEAICTTRVEVLSPEMKRLTSFQAKGEGTSPRVEVVRDDERNTALDQAARYAAISAAEQITPRRVRESISLDETAPSFEEGMVLIDSDRVAEARELWETALKKQPQSAPLRFNLGAVCEALGDLRAAVEHYSAARKGAPGELRYVRRVPQ